MNRPTANDNRATPDFILPLNNCQAPDMENMPTIIDKKEVGLP